MNNLIKITLVAVLFFINLLLVEGDNPLKKNSKGQFSVLNIPENLPVEDLKAGLRVLTTAELKTLSKFIDNQSKRPMENGYDTSNLLGVMENYWTRHARSAKSKKTRNIEDVYDEVAHDNGEEPLKTANEGPYNLENEGCTCQSLPDEIDENMRAKRENQYVANVEKGYSLEQYVRDLEDSFPRDQGEKTQNEGGTVPKGHLRFKRF